MKKRGVFILSSAVIGILLSYILDARARAFMESTRNIFFDLFFLSITNMVIVLILMIFIPSYILYKKNKDYKAVVSMLLTSFIFSVLLSLLIKLTFLRQRPDISIGYPLISVLDYSFPSMHAMIAFSLLPILLNYLEIKPLWISLAVLVALSRIYLEFHFLSDAVFGSLAGLLLGNTVLHIFNKNGKPKKI